MLVSDDDLQSGFSTKLLYDLSSWFIMFNNMIRINEFNHTIIELPENS